MNEPVPRDKNLAKGASDDLVVIRRVAGASAVLMLVIAAGGWYLRGPVFALSVVLGGGLVNGSFWLLSRDIRRLVQQVSAADEVAGTAKIRFVLRSMARLVVLALLLGALATRMAIDVIGLTLGLTTVVASVVLIGLGAGRRRLPNKV